MQIRDSQEALWAEAYEEARSWGFTPEDAWKHADDVVVGY